MKPLFIVRDGDRLIAAKRNPAALKPVIQFLAKGSFPDGVSRVAFALSHEDAYSLGRGLAVNLEQHPDCLKDLTLRLHDDFRGGMVDLDIRPCMAAELARQLLQKLGD